MILHDSLPYDPFATRHLPGIAPLGDGPWLPVDNLYTAQMAERRRLISQQTQHVVDEAGVTAAVGQETISEVLMHLPAGFTVRGDMVICPDGVGIEIDRDRPLRSLGQIVQSDICVMEPRDGVHVLTGAVLCFPASWLLSEKVGHPLIGIHAPVDVYDDALATRVQRLFDGIQPGRALWRFNTLWYDDPTLFQPRSATVPRDLHDPHAAPYFRSERQVLWRLPQTRAVLFTIHTHVLAREAVMAAFQPDRTKEVT